MKFHTLVLAFGGLVGAATMAQAQTTALPPGPLEKMQDAFGAIVGANFRVPDQIAATSPGGPPPVDPTIGKAFYESLAIPGAIFAAPYAAVDPDANAAPTPAAKPAARHHRHARGYHRPTPATAG